MKNLLFLLQVIFLTSAVQAQEVGMPAPDFTFDVLDGGSFTLSEQLGKVVVIFSFGYSCPYCVTSGPYIEAGLVQPYNSNDDVAIIGVDIWNGAPASVSTFRSNTGLTMPLLLKAGSFGTDYNTDQDKLFVVDKQGKLIFRTATSSTAGADVDIVATTVDEALSAPVAINSTAPTEFDFTGYPNPASNSVTLKFVLPSAGGATLSIVGLDGNTLINKGLEDYNQGYNSISMDISSLHPGVYFTTLEYRGVLSVQKLIVR